MKPLSKYGMKPMMTISPTGEIREVMTLRDHFARLAMQSLLIADGTTYFEQRAKEAYDVASATLKQRSLTND